MITIDCSHAISIKDKLLVHVADKLEAIPILKDSKFFLESLDENQIDKPDVIDAIKEFLQSLDLIEHFQIIPKDNTILIKQLYEETTKEQLEKITKSNESPFFECTHCGFMTLYEEELKTHRLIHYI